MQNLRSHLAAGAAALAGVGALAAVPVATPTASPYSPARVSIDVSLAGLDDPLTELLGTLGAITTDILGTGTYTSPYPVFTGIVPQFVADALPVVRQLGYNGIDYLNNSIQQLFTGPASTTVTVARAVWTLLPNVVTFGPAQAVQTLVGEVSGAARTALTAGEYVLTGVLNHLVPTVTGLGLYALPNVIFASVGAVSAVASAVVTVATQFVRALSAADLATAWNVAVDGLLGPVGADGKVTSSIPGTIEAVTLGNGIGQYGSPAYVPSLRVAVQGAVYSTANNLGGDLPRPAPANSAAARTAATAAAATPTEVTAAPRLRRASTPHAPGARTAVAKSAASRKSR